MKPQKYDLVSSLTKSKRADLNIPTTKLKFAIRKNSDKCLSEAKTKSKKWSNTVFLK